MRGRRRRARGRRARGSPGAARRVTSVCTGAYVLAAAGLLDGRRATTHWAWCDDFAARYPGRHRRRRPDLRPRRQRVDVGRRDRGHGPRARARRRRSRSRRRADDRAPTRAVRAAAGWSVAVQRAAGRASSRRVSRCASCSTGSSSIPTPTSAVDRLAARVAMSPRHFARVFRDEVGARRPPTSSGCASRSRAGCSRRPTTPSTRSRARPASAPPRRSGARSRAGSAPAPPSTETASARHRAS